MDYIIVITLLFFCQISGTHSADCPSEYTEYGGHCYRLHQPKENLTEARRTCKNEGGDLVSVNTQEECSFLIQKLSEYPGNYWIGMEYVSGQTRWFDGSAVNYTHWGDKNPDCMSTGCGAMFSKYLHYAWEDVGSYYVQHFICELVPSTPHPNPTVDTNTGCRPSYIPYGGNCYKVHHTPSNFSQSRASCQNEGGDLVSVNSQAEDSFLTQEITDTHEAAYWMGMEYVAGRYKWFDGGPVSYTNWRPGKPSCIYSGEHCHALYYFQTSYQWTDTVGTYEELFICEQGPSTQTTTTLQPNPDFQKAINFECHQLGWYVTVDLTKLSLRPSDVTEIYMNEDTCTGTMQGDLLVFNQTYKECNTRPQIADGKVTFNNYLVYAIRDSDNVIRDFRWKEDLHCSHDLHASGTVNVKPNITLQGSSSGNIPGSPVDISLFTDSAFKQPLHGTVKLGTPVYVQVLSLSHPDVVMVVDSCQTDITASTSQKPFALIQNHCSVETTTQILAVRNQLTRFRFDMMDLHNDQDGIDVTCNVIFCDPMDFSPKCEQHCKTGANIIG